MIKCVIFDIDNTLYSFNDSNKAALDSLREYCAKIFGWNSQDFDAKHLAVQHEIYNDLGYNGSCRDRMLRYQKMLEQSSIPLYPHAVKLYELYWRKMIDSLSPDEERTKLFQTLKAKGLFVGIGTDMTPYIQMLKLERMEILQYIDFIVTSEEAGLEKPEPPIFNMCLRKAKCEASECLFVGDDLKKDYQGAISVGMNALWFNLKHEKVDDVKEINSLTEILEHV